MHRKVNTEKEERGGKKGEKKRERVGPMQFKNQSHVKQENPKNLC